MTITTDYFFGFIAPGGSQYVFIHGYGDREFVSYSMVINRADVPSVGDGRATLSVGETIRWSVDGTIGRIVTVANTGNIAVNALILAQREVF